MTLKEKIGQLFVVPILPFKNSNEIADIDKLIIQYFIGSFIPNFVDISMQIELINHFQSLSRIPLLFMQDVERGLQIQLYDAIRYPFAMTLGAIQDDQLIYQLGKEVARQSRLVGVQMHFAPVIDINTNPNNPIIGVRAYSAFKDNVIRNATAYARGLRDGGVIPCAKHFPGHGDSEVDSHHDLPVIFHTKDRLLHEELVPFQAMIKEQIPAIMTAHIYVPSLESDPNRACTLSKKVITGLLKNELGFDGIILTDALDMKGITNHFQPGQSEVEALLAGNDMLVAPVDVPKSVSAILQALEKGIITQQEIDTRVLKILKLKEFAGGDESRFIQMPESLSVINTPAAYALKQSLYREAITVVRDTRHLIPFNREGRKIAMVSIGGSPDLNHPSIDSFHLPTNSSEELIATIMNRLATYDLIIVTIFALTTIPVRYGLVQELSKEVDSIFHHLNRLEKDKIFILFMNPYNLRFINQECVIVAYDPEKEAWDAAFDILFGRFPSKGILPIF